MHYTFLKVSQHGPSMSGTIETRDGEVTYQPVWLEHPVFVTIGQFMQWARAKHVAVWVREDVTSTHKVRLL